MPLFRRSGSNTQTISDITRIELFSDAVLAIIITLLVLEIHIPELHGETAKDVFGALLGIAPKLLSFAFSFLTIAVFWVNHHHFFHEIERSDWRLLWHNNSLLFWLSLVPFTTAFLGENPFNRWVAMVYCFSLFMAALSFLLLIRHALFCGNLVHEHIPTEERTKHFRHSMIGVVCYGLSTITAPLIPLVSIALMIFIPLYYITPRLMHDHDGMGHELE